MKALFQDLLEPTMKTQENPQVSTAMVCTVTLCSLVPYATIWKSWKEGCSSLNVTVETKVKKDWTHHKTKLKLNSMV
jgi:hypothetical protein